MWCPSYAAPVGPLTRPMWLRASDTATVMTYSPASFMSTTAVAATQALIMFTAATEAAGAVLASWSTVQWKLWEPQRQ